MIIIYKVQQNNNYRVVIFRKRDFCEKKLLKTLYNIFIKRWIAGNSQFALINYLV